MCFWWSGFMTLFTSHPSRCGRGYAFPAIRLFIQKNRIYFRFYITIPSKSLGLYQSERSSLIGNHSSWKFRLNILPTRLNFNASPHYVLLIYANNLGKLSVGETEYFTCNPLHSRSRMIWLWPVFGGICLGEVEIEWRMTSVTDLWASPSH